MIPEGATLQFFLSDRCLSAVSAGLLANQRESNHHQQAVTDTRVPRYESDAAGDSKGEPLQEDRKVPCDEEEAVVYSTVTVNSPLRVLRKGCESFGLSKRGSK